MEFDCSPRKDKNMNFKVYAVKDELSEQFLTPIFVEKEEQAKRSFTWQINNTPIWDDNASDFSLYRLGYFNSETGDLTPSLEKVVSGHTVLRKE